MESTQSKLAAKDERAAALLTQLREDAGLSPEALSRAIFVADLGFVSGRTIRNIENEHHVPTLRVRASIARYFDRNPRSIWRNAPTFQTRSRRVAA